MTTEDLWEAFTQGGVMIHCIRYGCQDRGYARGFREALEGEVIAVPTNVRLRTIPRLLTASPVSDDDDPVDVAIQNAAVADRVLREVVERTGLTFQFTGDAVSRAFVFDGPNPTVLVEPDESVELDMMPVTIRLTAR